jgi:hypothetical protein
MVVADNCFITMEMQKLFFQILDLSEHCDFCGDEDEFCEKIYNIIRLELLKPLNLQSYMPICLILIDPDMDGGMRGIKAVKSIKTFYNEVNLSREIKLVEPHIVFVTSHSI